MRKLYYDYQIGDKPLPIPDQDVEISRADLDSEESGRERTRPKEKTQPRHIGKGCAIHV